ncbi:TonB-linked SusC/RagA family outer membrane protein [Flavobacterium sp. W4I14]|nr:TonB-linked SusC/RagA family outer membrane protein [Flavobacterium sp. W4I14]
MKFTLLAFMLMCTTLMFAQQAQTIKGKVNDETGQPLVGATVLLTIEKKTVATDVDGYFSTVSNNTANKIQISFVGYKTKELPLSDFGRQLTVSMEKEGINMDEVVVVGYGTATKKDLTGAVSTLSGDLLSDRKTTRVSQALQGAVPGVSVTRSSGGPAAGSTIRIRGITTLGVNDPLVIVDGVPGNIDNISPDDIENISVLKDAASSAIYGSRAAAGVILVSTKRAKNGQASITYSADFGLEKITSLPTFADAATWMRLNNEMKTNDGLTPVYANDLINNYASLNAADPDKYPNTDWQKIYFKNSAFQQRHNLDISLGNKNVRSKVIFGYLNQPGMDPNRSFERYSFRVNNDLTITDKLSANVDFAFYRAQAFNAASSDLYAVKQLPSIYDDFYSDGRYAPGKDGVNPLANNYLGGNYNSRNNQLNARLQLNYDAFKGFKLSGVFAPQLGFIKYSTFNKMVPYSALNDPSVVINTFRTTNSLTETQGYSQAINAQLLANYQFELATDHKFTALLGFESNAFRDESSGQYRDGYLLTDYQVIDAGSQLNWSNSGNANESALRSFFGRLTYNFKNRYLVQTNFRYDGSSRFSPENRWGFFPSVSAGWVISEENFFKNRTPFSFLKLRGSWGRNGNQQIGNYSYQALVSLGSALFYNSAGQIVPASIGNQEDFAVRNKTWETKEDYDIGIDAAFFNSRLTLTADYFHKNTYDILLNLPIPLNTGLNTTSQNAGKLINNGWELQLSWNDKIGEDWSYSISANLSDFKNKIVDLKGTSTLGDQALLEGQPYNAWYGYENLGYFKDAADVAASAKLTGAEKPGDIKFRDINGDGKITADKDRVVLGNSLPRYMYGGNASIKYKQIDFGFSFQGIGKQLGKPGSLMYQPFTDNFGNVPNYMVDNTWTPERPDAKYPRLTYNNRGGNFAGSDFYLFNSAYFRLKDITLGYTFKAKLLSRIGVKNARLFVSATDLFSLSKYPKGWDPEGGQTDNPIVTTYYSGLSVTF